MTDRILAIFNRTNDVLVFLSGIVLAFIVVSVSAEVVLRYFFNSPIKWTIEVNENCLLYITFLTTAQVLARDSHVNVEMVINGLRPKAQHFISSVTCFVGFLMCLILTWYAAQVTWSDFQAGAFAPGPNKIPESSVLFVIPIGLFLLSCQFLIKFCQKVKGNGKHGKEVKRGV